MGEWMGEWINLFNKYLLSTYYVPYTMGHRVIKKIPLLVENIYSSGIIDRWLNKF